MQHRQKIEDFCRENRLEIDSLEFEKFEFDVPGVLPGYWMLMFKNGRYYESDSTMESMDSAVNEMLYEIRIDGHNWPLEKPVESRLGFTSAFTRYPGDEQ